MNDNNKGANLFCILAVFTIPFIVLVIAAHSLGTEWIAAYKEREVNLIVTNCDGSKVKYK